MRSRRERYPKLVFWALWKSGQTSRGVKMTQLEREQLLLLRRDLDLPPHRRQHTHVRRQLLTPLLLQEISDLTDRRRR